MDAADRRTTERVRLEDVDAFAGHLVVHQRSGGLTQLRILELGDDGRRRRLPRASSRRRSTRSAAGGNPQFDQPTVRLRLHLDGGARRRSTTTTSAPASSPCSSSSRCSAATTPRRTRSTGCGRPPTTASGCRSRWSAAAGRAATRARAPIPLLLYGYGAYEISIDPYFSIARLSLLDRGAGFAIAHVRGGGEMGRRWYDDGKLLHKQQHLLRLRRLRPAPRRRPAGPRPDRLVAEGGSRRRAADRRGGQPGTRRCSAGSSPRCRSSTRSPRCSTRACRSPSPSTTSGATPRPTRRSTTTSPATRRTRTSRPSDYPPILAETSLNDTRVLYVEPAKWVARLRATATGPARLPAQDRDVGRPRRACPGATSPGTTGPSRCAWILDRMGLADVAPAASAAAAELPDFVRSRSPENSLRVPRGRNSEASRTSGTGEGSDGIARESSGHRGRWRRRGHYR